MPDWTRRDLLKTGVAASLSGLVRVPGAADHLGAGALDAGGEAGAESLPVPGGRERLLLDFGWRFQLGHANDPTRDFGFGLGEDGQFGKTGEFFAACAEDFDDTAWEAVDLPHDWAVDLPFTDDSDVNAQGAKPLGRAYPATSIGWYRRVFTLPAGDAGRRLSLVFDGAFRDAIVALNGVYLTRNLSGYAPFRCDITDVAAYGGKNVLVVRLDASEHEGWFYEGAGIYRHVWMEKTHPVHVAPHGTYVTAEVGKGPAMLTVTTEVANDDDADAHCRVVSTIVDDEGREVARARTEPGTVAGWETRTFRQRIPVPSARLWGLDAPHLYACRTAIEAATGGATLDQTETTFGIRTVRFDADHGLFLNGQPVKIQGTCNHQDHAGVGAALPDRLQAFRIERLKEMGCNAYRTSHNPPTPELLDACDRLGMLVLDETRMFGTSREALSQLERMVRRDRHHPSVFCWSLANEEWLEQGLDRGARILRGMKRLVRRLDPTRPVTAAMNGSWGKGVSFVVDVQGFNYGDGKGMDAFHTAFPKQPSMGSEVASTLCTRGEYADDGVKGYVNAYDKRPPRWGATAESWWTTYMARPWVAGGFVWTGFDYRGEPTPYAWPCISSHFGIMDTCGFPKDNYYYYQAWWRDGARPVLHLFPHWNWPGREGQEIEVWCHTNLNRVELVLDGRSLGAQDVARLSHAVWKVPYAPGRLEVRGFRNGQQVLTDARETTGAPAKLALAADRATIRADREDVAVVEVRVLDDAGRVVPVASDEVTFRLTGSAAGADGGARILGVGNGDPSSHEPDRAERRRAFNGLCVAIVQAGTRAGELRVEATAPGLGGASAVVTCAPATPRPAAS